MPDRSRKKRTLDVNMLAASIVAEATGEAEQEGVPATAEAKPEKDAAAVSLGRRGGLKGGKARAAALSPKKRSSIAKKAAQARWAKQTVEN